MSTKAPARMTKVCTVSVYISAASPPAMAWVSGDSPDRLPLVHTVSLCELEKGFPFLEGKFQKDGPFPGLTHSGIRRQGCVSTVGLSFRLH